MPNILLTQRCTRSCPYCFATKHMSESSESELSWENLIYLADFLQASGENRFSILGGEPTLHANFNDFVLYLLERNFTVSVFTNGVIAEDRLEETARLFHDVPFERLSFTCNLNDPERTPAPPGEIESVRRFLSVFGRRTIPGFNIYRTDFELDFLFHYINEFGLHRNIRVGLAHPILGRDNAFISLDDIDPVIDRLFSYRDLFERLRIKFGLDCGFPLCRFSDGQLAWLYRYTGGQSRFVCHPVVDIGPDMTVWPCFPLSAFHNKSIFDFNSLREIHEYYARIHTIARIEAGGIFEECDTCVFREDQSCFGGCLAHILSRFQDEAAIRMGEVYL